MPNHCSNNLTVSGPVEDVAAFVKAAEGAESLVDAFFPMPEELRGTTVGYNPDPDEVRQRNIELYGAPDWYEWAHKNWGSKWGDYDTDLLGHTHDAGHAAFVYTTAWGPMEQAIANISKRFPTLLFEVVYEEGGSCLLGATVHQAGELIGEAHLSDDEWPEPTTDEDGQEDWDAFEEAMWTLRDRVVSDAGAGF